MLVFVFEQKFARRSAAAECKASADGRERTRSLGVLFGSDFFTLFVLKCCKITFDVLIEVGINIERKGRHIVNKRCLSR